MSVCRFDTFENETELLQMIKKLQSKSIEYMKLRDPWDIQDSKQADLQETVPV